MFIKKIQFIMLCFYVTLMSMSSNSASCNECVAVTFLDDPAVRIIKSCTTITHVPGRSYERLIREEPYEVDTGVRIGGLPVTEMRTRRITQTEHVPGRTVEENIDCRCGAGIVCFFFRLNQIAGAAIPIHSLLHDINLGDGVSGSAGSAVSAHTAVWAGAGLTIASTLFRSLMSCRESCDSDYPKWLGLFNRSVDVINSACFVTAAILLGNQNQEGPIDSYVKDIGLGLLLTSVAISSLDAFKSCCTVCSDR